MKKSISENGIVLMRKMFLLLALAVSFHVNSAQLFVENTENVAKTDSVKGRVLNGVTGQPIAGAQIQTADPKYAAMTDENGTFTINYTHRIPTFTVSAPGFEKREIPVLKFVSKPEINLYPATFGNYYDNVLSVFGNKRQTEIVNAQKSIVVDNFSSLTVDNELAKNLSGEILTTKYSGTPASGSTMFIRGVNSINASTQPLIVIDGIIFDNQSDKYSIHLGNILSPLSGLDVNDIQSISVLKDGTSLYGSKGANGVILISTNRGRSMATKITVSSLFGFNLKPQSIPTMDAGQYRLYLSDLLRDETAQKDIANQFFLNNNTNFIYYNKYHNNTDWSEGVYTNSFTQGYNVSVNGGDEIALYNLSVGLTNAPSTLRKNNFNRINTRFNSDINFTSKLTTTFDISFVQTVRKLRNDGIAESYTNQINSPAYLALIKSPFLSPYQYANNGEITTKIEDYDFLNVANPYAINEYGIGNSQQTYFNLALTPTYKISDNLSISTRFGYSLNNMSENFFSPMYGVAPYINKDEKMTSYNYVKTQFANYSSLLSDTRVNWLKETLYGNWRLNAGVRYLQDKYVSEFATGHNTGSDQVKEMSGNLQYKTVGGFDEPFKMLTYYGLLNYSFADKYFVEAALTAETSSRFGVDAKSGLKLFGVSWALFPSLNAAWLISSEEFMKDAGFINLLKLRAGYGITGNDGIQSNAARTYFKAAAYSGTAIGLQIYNISNPEVQWETVAKTNAGIDAGILDERLSLSFDVYNNVTNNLLVQKNLNPVTGLDSYWSNDGRLLNRGFELAVSGKVVNTKDLTVNVNFTVAHNQNKILALADGDYLTRVYGGEVLTAENQPFGQFYGYKTNGVYKTADEAAADGLNMRAVTGALVPFEAGDVRFVNQNSDNVIDENDRVVIGNSNPDFFGMFGAGMKYKRLQLSANFNYVYGNDIYNFVRSQIESGSTFNNQSMAMNNRWISEGQNTAMPKSTYGDPKGNNRFSDRWIEDGSFLRLKAIEISYDLPVKGSYLQGLKVWASAQNLWTLTNYLGPDPEFSFGNNIFYRGIDAGLLQGGKSFFAGLKINL